MEDQPVEQIMDDENDWNVAGNITKEHVEKAIEKLPEKYQWVIKLYLMEGYDHTEISEILQIAQKTSRTQLRRGKLLLQKQLKSYRDEERS